MTLRLNTGQIVSGAGHIALIGWAFLGGLFTSEPLQFEVTEVTAISAEDYAALVAARESPTAASDVVTPDAPEIDEASPDMAATQDDPVDQTRANEAPVATEPDAVPDIVPDTSPEAEVSDAPPTLETPSEDVAVLLPKPDKRPQPRPIPRVAPEPVAPPEPDVRIDDVVREEIAPSDQVDAVADAQDATSPEEAATEIVTEADDPAQAAPSRSVRPRTRPTRIAAAAPETPRANPPSENAVKDALAEALGSGGTDTNPEPTGPPLTRGEKDALVVSVSRCWNVGALSSDALRTTVVVGVEISRDGTPISASIRLVESSGGAGRAVEQAFEAGRRAIIRCGASGFDLPAEKYDRWRLIEMVFDPEKMRIK